MKIRIAFRIIFPLKKKIDHCSRYHSYCRIFSRRFSLSFGYRYFDMSPLMESPVNFYIFAENDLMKLIQKIVSSSNFICISRVRTRYSIVKQKYCRKKKRNTILHKQNNSTYYYMGDVPYKTNHVIFY